MLLFGGAADRAGARMIRVQVDDRPRCDAVLAAIGGAVPSLAPLIPTARLAVNQEFTAADRRIEPTDEVALIAMVSGG